jgi:CRP/FNR family cyclic AMP-dependent transcriptional regulator
MEWPLLASLRAEDREAFLALATPRPYDRGEIVCVAGDRADGLHLVTAGRLAVHVSLESGTTAFINLLAPGDYFGELALLVSDGRRTASITALEPSETRVVSAVAFRTLCRDRPTVERAVSVLLAHRVHELSQRLIEAMHVGLEERLRRRLVELAGVYGHGRGPAVIPLTQAQLADMTGGTRPSVNVALQGLVERGLVVLGRGKVTVVDPGRLAALARH